MNPATNTNPVVIPPSPPPAAAVATPSRTNGTNKALPEPAASTVTHPNDIDNSANHLTIIQSIVDQIHLGKEEISPHELKALDKAIDALSTAAKCRSSRSRSSFIPHVNREFVTSCASDPKVLVRYVGMVQDMLDPEYYVTKVGGVFTKYREYYASSSSHDCGHEFNNNVYDDDDDDDDDDAQGQRQRQSVRICNEEDEMTSSNKNWCLEERQPLVLVPIPNSTCVLRDFMGGGGGGSYDNDNNNDDKHHENRQRAKKRTCEELKSDAASYSLDNNDKEENVKERTEKEDSCHYRKYKQHEPSSKDGSNCVASRQTTHDCDWWPKGCLDSDDTQCPVLAKMYYSLQESSSRGDSSATTITTDEAAVVKNHQKRLQLNDIVQVYGILSLDPRGATFDSSMTCMSQQQNGISLEDMTFGLDHFMDAADAMSTPPPPSLLPRLHVLKYDVLDLDVYMAQREEVEEKTTMDDTIDDENDRQFTINFFAMHIFGGNPIAAEVLLMVIMSMAERNHRYDDNRTVRMPSGETLGCGSINYVLLDSESCAILHEKLNAVLGMILPVVANVNVSLSSLNSVEDDSISTVRGVKAPTKNNANRLDPSILQLPKASFVIVNQAYMSEGGLKPSGQRTLTALAKMSSTHTIPYRFEGEMEIDFEADIRTIVLSVNKKSLNAAVGSKLMPCSLVMRLDSQSREMIDSTEAMMSAHQQSFFRIRRYIVKCRSNTNFSYNSIALNKSILERAQKDFIQERQKSKTLGRREVTEQDFHRWLLLTRLQARSQIGVGVRKSRDMSFEAEIEDWENAMVLDEGMR